MKAVLASAFIFFVNLAGPASSLEFQAVLVLQSALKHHGFDPGEPDGHIGPATRKALKGFAEKYGSDEDAESVFRFMVQQSLKARTAITDEKTLEIIKVGIAKELRDPDSAKIRNVFKVDQGELELVCGEVNGKNAYGGYAGFTAFFGAMVTSFFPIGIDTSDNAIAAYTCATTFPPQS